MSWDIVGHAWAVDLLRGHVLADQVRHAYLFAGAQGLGRRTLALCMAKVLFCESPPAKGEACGTCHACQAVAVGRHPDLHLLQAEEGGSIKVEEIRELQAQLALAPHGAARRFALLRDFESATDSAQNALLKTLEEPAGRVVMVLTAASPEAVLPTVASRCETLTLRPVARVEVERGLQARGVAAAEAALSAAICSGRPGWALRFAGDPALQQGREKILADLLRVLAADRIERFDFAAKLADRLGKLPGFVQRKAESRQILEHWMSLLRDGLRRGHSVEGALENPDQAEVVAALNAGWKREEVLRSVQAVESTLQALDRNANLQLAWEALMLDLPRLTSARQ